MAMWTSAQRGVVIARTGTSPRMDKIPTQA